ncbi:SAF domain-containing protein [Catenulispora pinisilvae]|uniref:SAF domain-containing protein n=1 Tax=Catenulispora pinisilvae TaxID=2705253 RepID=UPI001891BFCB|nr:SAF domain-containing protein [Catenulispora pinisilvae]
MLAIAQPIAAGQVITDNDVRTVNVGASAELGLVASIDESKVVGHVAAMPLVPGTLLTAQMVGTADFPPVGQAVVGVALKAGTFPPRLEVGDRVNVWPGPSEAAVSTTTAPAAPLAAGAVVTSIGATDSLGTSVVTLLVDDQSAPKVSQATSVSVIEVAPSPAGQP